MFKSKYGQCIDTYLMNFQFPNFEEDFKIKVDFDQNNQDGENFPNKLSLKRMNKFFNKIRKPLEKDKKVNVINYNWVVDGILKSSMPYETQREVQYQIMSGKMARPTDLNKQKILKKRKDSVAKSPKKENYYHKYSTDVGDGLEPSND